MRRSVLAALALGAAFLAAAPAERAMASGYGAPAYGDCQCARDRPDWPRRHYWQWDHRPIWDDPWLVLKPNILGSSRPHLIPADIWAHKWHPPWLHHWRAHHRRWRRDP